MVLKVNWTEFQNKLETLIAEGETLLENFKSSRAEEELHTFKQKSQLWESSVIDYVETSFEPKNIDFAYNFKENHPFISGNNLAIYQQTRNAIQSLKAEINGLGNYLKALSIADAIIRPSEIDLKERQNLDTEGKLNLILSKLFDLYGDEQYHSIQWILEGNGVELQTTKEHFDFGRMLEDCGYANIMAARDTMARLTLEGKYAIEQARKEQVTDYSKISDSNEELKRLIEEVLKEIKKQGMGQQIIFDEFDELRDDIPHLSKKSFGQLLKSKLGDLVANKAIDKVFANDIFKQFTDQILPF